VATRKRATRRVAAPAQAAAPSTNGRTEEDKVFQGPIKVVLGGVVHLIRPLTIREAREWREKVAPTLTVYSRFADVSSDDRLAFQNAMTAMVMDTPNQMADFFFSYAKDLDRLAIEEVATEYELAEAITAVQEVAFPLLRTLTRMTGRLMGVR